MRYHTVSGIQPFTVTVSNVCFCHWPVPADTLTRSVPDWLTVETAAGSAWVTVIHTTITGISAFGVDLSRPAEAVIVRTYVRGPRGQRGLYVFALVPGEPIAATTATPLLRLPIRQGTPTRDSTGDRTRTKRTLDMGANRVFAFQYDGSTTEPAPAPPDSLAAFLVERHRYFTTGPLGSRGVGNVGHDPWNIAPIDATVSGRLLPTLGLPGPIDEPLCQFSSGLELHVGPPKPLWLE